MVPSFKILEVVADFYHISIGDLKGRSRMKDIAQARQVASYLLRDINDLSYPAIGKLTGKDHTTAIHAYNKITSEISKNPKFAAFVLDIRSRFPREERAAIQLPANTITEGEADYLNKKILSESKNNGVGYETSEDILNSGTNIEISQREADILSRYRQGQTLEEIAAQFNVTRERIRQITFHTLVKELGQKAKEGFKVDVKEYIESQRQLHNQSKIFPVEKKKEFINKVQRGEKLKQLMREYGLNKERLLEVFPEYEGMLALEMVEKKRWSSAYDRCRSCKLTVYPHVALGYCEKCYTKSPEFKAMQKKSFEKNKEKRQKKNQAYLKEYTQRPEVKAKMMERWNKTYFDGNRDAVLERDRFKCVNCGITQEESERKYGRRLHVRHIDNNPKNNALENLESLCPHCFLVIKNRQRLTRKI